MNAEQQALLRAPFDPSEVGKLPRVTCRDCSGQGSTCSKHNKVKCPMCGAYISTQHIHLDFVGHAELTDRLLDVDPDWNWEPVAWVDGAPAVQKHGNNLVMWGHLTLCGITRPGVGTAAAGKDDAHKELIGDFLRNAAMRFGVALDLWRKSEKAEQEHPVEIQPLAGWESIEEQETAHQDFKDAMASHSDDVQAHLREWRSEKKLPWPMPRTDLDVMWEEVAAATKPVDDAQAKAERLRAKAAENAPDDVKANAAKADA